MIQQKGGALIRKYNFIKIIVYISQGKLFAIYLLDAYSLTVEYFYSSFESIQAL